MSDAKAIAKLEAERARDNERTALIKERLPVPALTGAQWRRIGEFVDNHHESIGDAGTLADGYRKICERGSGRPKSQKFLASVLQIMRFRGLSVAGHAIREFPGDQVQLTPSPILRTSHPTQQEACHEHPSMAQ